MNISVIVYGLNEVGSNFSRDFMRFADCYKNQQLRLSLYFVDSTEIKKEDIASQYFLSKDIAFNKASTMKYVWENAFSRNMTVKAFGMDIPTENGELVQTTKFRNSMYSDEIMIYIVCTKNVQERRTLYNSFKKEKDAILLMYTDTGISASVRSKKKDIYLDEHSIENVPDVNVSLSKALSISHLTFAYLINMLSNGNMEFGDFIFDYENMASGKKEKFPPIIKGRSTNYSCTGKTALICVGVGGTGGNLCRDIVKFLLDNEDLVLVLIDGDRVEEKNRTRQPFGMFDLQQYKAEVFKNQLSRDYPGLQDRIIAIPCYLERVEQLEQCLNPLQVENEIILGCVDNHRARQVLHEYFERKDTLLYIDSANEFNVGEVVVSVKKNQKVIAPARAYYFPDVLTDKSPSAAELSCGVVNQSAPQHQVTNVVAAHIILLVLEKLLHTGEVMGGIEFFNSFEYFSRFQPYDMEE